MRDTTVVYYTNNREFPNFQRNIQQIIMDNCGGLPIISVSQRPIDFGQNICIGTVGSSGHNVFRQMQIGAMSAKTKYVCIAEADNVYPKEYFEFTPPDDDKAYLASPLWVAFAQRGYGKYYALKPRGSESAMHINRLLLVKLIDKMFKGFDYWGKTDSNGQSFQFLLKPVPRIPFELSVPVLTVKTSQNMHMKTPHEPESRIKELAPYGEIHRLIERLRA